MMQDLPRATMPAEAAWNLVDFIPDLGDTLRGRGGWTYASPALGSGSTYVNAVAYANFSAGAKLVAITDNAKLFVVATSASATTSVSSGVNTPLQVPVMHQDHLIIPASDGTTKMQSFTGGAGIQSITNGPAAKYVTVYKDRTVAANTNAQKTYVYFGPPSDPIGAASAASAGSTWNLTTSWISFSHPITGLAALPNVILVFMEKQTGRIRGSVPPPGSDMIQDDPLFNVGCTDARSIAVNAGFCIFANPLGVYKTNGSLVPEDLTASCGLKKYWTDQLASYASASWTLAGGFYRNRYYISVMNGATFVDAFCFDPDARQGYRLSNVKAQMMVPGIAVQDELWFASRSESRVNRVSAIWSPAASNKNDADGTVIAYTLETPFYYGPVFYRHRYFPDPIPSKKSWKALYVDYDLRDAASDNPVLTVSYIKNIGDAYTALSQTLGETTDRTYAKLNLNFASNGVGFKIVQTNASQDTRITKLSAVMHLREESRVG